MTSRFDLTPVYAIRSYLFISGSIRAVRSHRREFFKYILYTRRGLPEYGKMPNPTGGTTTAVETSWPKSAFHAGHAQPGPRASGTSFSKRVRGAGGPQPAKRASATPEGSWGPPASCTTRPEASSWVRKIRCYRES